MWEFCYGCEQYYDDDYDHEVRCEGGGTTEFWEDEAIPYDLYEWNDDSSDSSSEVVPQAEGESDYVRRYNEWVEAKKRVEYLEQCLEELEIAVCFWTSRRTLAEADTNVLVPAEVVGELVREQVEELDVGFLMFISQLLARGDLTQ